MSTPPPAQTEPSVVKAGPAPRRVPAPPAKPRRDFRLPLAAGAVALVIGFGSGIVVTRHRRDAVNIVASVNGVVITKDDLFQKLEAVAGQPTIHKMVEEDLQLQFARQKGVVPTDAQVEAQLARDKQNPDFDKALTARGITLETYKQALRVRLAQSMVFAQGVSITDAEAKAWYQAAASPSNPASRYYTPESINLSVISVPTTALARAAMKELNSGTPFALAASTYSTDPSKAQGGAIQPLLRGRNPVSKTPALESALFKLPVGGTYGPVAFEKLQWIFHCERKMPAETLPFSAVSEQVRQDALAAKGQKINGARIAKEFTEFQRSSKLKAFWPQYEKSVTGQ